MMIPKPLYRRVAEAARPPVALENVDHVFFLESILNSLVISKAWLQRDLKEPFLALWVNEPEFDDPDIKEPIEKMSYENLRVFAAMDPVVDLESLREPKTT